MPVPVSADRQLDIVARLQLGIVADPPPPAADGQRSAVRHRVARVDREVEHRHFQLRRIGHHRHQMRVEVELLLDPRPQHIAKQRPHLLDQRRDIGRLHLQPLDPAEGEQLAGQPRPPLRRRKRVGRVAQQPLVLDLLGDQVEAADDDRQQIVEVMRNAAGQLAERLHFLALAKLVLRRLQLGDVPRLEQQIGDLVAAGREPAGSKRRGPLSAIPRAPSSPRSGRSRPWPLARPPP